MSLPSLEEFNLIGMAQAERIEGEERWFSLPAAILDRLPRILLKQKFRDTSAPLVAGPTMPFVVDGIFDLRLYAIWAKKQGNAPIEAVNGVGDQAIFPFCKAALAPLAGDYRGRDCKKFLALLEEFAQTKAPHLLLAYLPCLSLVSLVDVNLTDSKSIVSAICESTTISTDDRFEVASELGKMADLAGRMILNNLAIFTPDRKTPKIEATQIKAWATALLKISQKISPDDTPKFPRIAHRNAGAKLLLEAAHQLNSVIDESMKVVRRTRQQVAPAVVDENIDTEPVPEFIEAGDEPEAPVYEAPEAGGRSLYRVVDIASLKADTALAKLCRENWQTAKLLRLTKAMSALELDPENFEALACENPHAAAPLLAVARSLRLFSQFGRQPLTCKPLLLVGASGTGKSYVARQIASKCSGGTPYQYLSLAGMSDSREIIGTPRGWSTCGPSLPVEALSEGVVNPFIILDEIEKAGTSTHNGSALSALLPALEPSTAKVWYDSFLSCQIDASMVNYIATANTLTGLSAPLLSRFQIYHLRPPKPEHFPKIIASVIREFSVELGVHPALLPQLDGEDISFLIESCEGNIRLLSQTVRRILEHRAAEAHQGVLH